jgi:hypothetical protein
MSRLKISAISYLNTAPLMWDFEHGQAGADVNFEISYTIPSACAEALRAGRPILASFRLQLIRRFRISSSFRTWQLRHDGGAVDPAD